MKERLQTYLFDLPVHELRCGYRSDVYFMREKIALETHDLHPNVTMQIFQKHDALLCGMDETIAVLKLASGRYTDWKKARNLFDRHMELKRSARKCFLEKERDTQQKLLTEKIDISNELDALWECGLDDLKLEALHDGDSIAPWETVMHVTGDAGLFAHLETIYLGILARRTRIATNTRKVVEAAAGKMVLYFPARFDHWAIQGGDGYAAHIGGASGVSTDAQAEWWDAKATGTVPHALIASVGGDTVKATRIFGGTFPDVNLVALVDFDNDCVGTALKCCEAMGEKLWGVRLDTSDTLVDKSIAAVKGDKKPTGVVPELVLMTRKALDDGGFGHVKIVVSGGFTAEKIAAFEKHGVPVDAYGVGSALMRGSYDFTADVVLLDGEDCAKVGREYKPNPRLELVE